MPSDPDRERLSSTSQVNASTRLNWQYPIWLVTMSFVLTGCSAVLLFLLPKHLDVSAFLTALIFIGVSRFGSQPSRLSPLQTVWIGSEAYSYFGLRQSVLNGFAFFVSILIVWTWFRGRLPGMPGFFIAALGGLVFGAFGVDLQAEKPYAGEEVLRVGIAGKLRNLVTARFLLKFIILSSIFEIVGLWQQPFRADVFVFALTAGLVVAALSRVSELDDDAVRTNNA